MSHRLDELLDLIRGHRVFIQTHNFPDQDAIASAFGLQVLLADYGIKTIICHHGCVERTATADMVTQFGIEMTTDDDLNDMREDDYIINVDSQKGNSNIRDLVGDEVACIDHHPVFCEAESYRFKDIRIVGSCATIIADYYRQNGVEMPENVATALLYGLKCDTKDFTRGVTRLDVDIFNYLFPKADSRLIRRFQSSAIQFDELSAFTESMRKIEIYNGIAFTYLDFDCADAFMATVSDFILGIDRVFFAVVYTKRGNGFKFSVRSDVDELDAGRIVSAAFHGIGGGGGHKSMAGGYVDGNEIQKFGEDFNGVIRRLFLNAIEP